MNDAEVAHLLFAEVARLRAERDELLAALREIATGRQGAIPAWWMTGTNYDRGRKQGYDEQAGRARAAIAKVEDAQDIAIARVRKAEPES